MMKGDSPRRHRISPRPNSTTTTTTTNTSSTTTIPSWNTINRHTMNTTTTTPITSTNTPKHTHDDSHTKLAKLDRVSKCLFDIPLLVLIVVIIVVGLSVALLTFFLLRKKDNEAIDRYIVATTTSEAKLFASQVNDFLAGINSVRALFSSFHYSINGTVAGTQIVTPWTFDHYMNQSGLLKVGFADISWLPRVTAAEFNGYQHLMRSFGIWHSDPYNNFNVYTIDDKNKTHPLTYQNKTVFYPISYIHPFCSRTITALQYDSSSEAVRYAAIQRAVETRTLTITPRLVLVRDGTVALQVFGAVFPMNNPHEHSAVIRGVFRMDELLSTLRITKSHFKIAVFDDSTDAAHLNAAFVYGNLNQGYTEKEKIEKIVHCTRHSVTIADRQFTIYFVPMDCFFASMSRNYSQKWIVLVVTIVVSVVLAIATLILLIVKTLLSKSFVSGAIGENTLLSQNNQRLETLLDKLSAEEQRFRVILSIVPYALIVVDHDGLCIDCNKAFRAKFGYSKHHLVESSFNTLFPNFLAPLDMFTKASGTEISTVLKSKFGYTMEVQIAISTTNFNKEDIYHHTRDKQEDILYVIMIVSSDDYKKTVIDRSATDLQSELEFCEILYHPEKRSGFKRYCIQHQNEENILFVEAVLEYKLVESTSDRVRIQQQILDNFLKEKGKYELNIARCHVNDELPILSNGLGQLDTFDNLFKIVCVQLRVDVFNGYKREILGIIDLNSGTSTTTQAITPQQSLTTEIVTIENSLISEKNDYIDTAFI
jgi:CHASE1-domain containing sensor protein